MEPDLTTMPPDLWFAVAIGVLMAALFLRSRLSYLSLGKLAAADTPHNRPGFAAAPDCMVVIPARNEEAFIADAIRSLPPDSVIVVDDHSEDRTAEEAAQAGAGVLKAPELRRGAAGKPSACAAGARAITSRWILFADADTRFSPEFLAAAVACAESSGVALLSIYLDPQFDTLAERVFAPYLIALFFCGANPRGDPRTVFDGQCLLARRDGYEFLGGHGSVINDVPEDIRLAALARRHRLTLGIARANGLGRVRWRELAQAVERGARRFMIVSPWMGGCVVAAALTMAAWLPALLWLIVEDHLRAALAYSLLPFALMWSWYGSSRDSSNQRHFASLAVLALPSAIYLTLPMLWHGFFGALRGRPVEWKGRTIG